MRNRLHKKDNDHSQGSNTRFPPWLITYSDLITLLLTFFILLMSMADLDPVRFDAASNSLKGAFGIRPHQTAQIQTPPILHSPPIIQSDSLESPIMNRLHKRFQHKVEDQKLQPQPEIIRSGADTILVRIQEALLFEPGSSELQTNSIALLDMIADGIDDHPIELLAEGHCDFFEGGVDSDENWELSTARAVSVLRYFVNNNLLSPDRLSAAGYGALYPEAAGVNSTALSMNRRVDIILRAKVFSGTGSANESRRGVPL